MVYTNNPWSGAMRGFGASQVTFASESQMDLLAQAVGIDPIEIRLRNILTAGSETATGQTLLASVGIRETLERVREYRDRWAKSAVTPGTPSLRRGIGTASIYYGIGNTGKPNPATAQIEIDPTGEIRLFTGASEIGQGLDTDFLQIASEALELPMDGIRLIRGDTAITTDAGITSSSRQTYVSGNAVLAAVRTLKEDVIKEAARLMEADPTDLMVEAGNVRRISRPSVSLSMREVAKRCERILRGEGMFDPATTPLDPKTGQGIPYATYAFATHLAEVEVDIETGLVNVQRVVACHDLGKVINPQAAKGQIVGGVIMGVGHAIMEEFIPGKTSSFADYLIPTTKDIPEVIPLWVEDPEPTGPFGAKGLGEPAFVPAAPAIMNAIADAIGARIYQMPATLERVREAVRQTRPGEWEEPNSDFMGKGPESRQDGVD
jgi:CO/xanthine dehydrogenase Mo-binding subunit